MATKKRLNKDWKFEKITTKYQNKLFQLLDDWKTTLIKETKLRKTAHTSLENFKTWYLIYLKACQLDDQVTVLSDNYKRKENKTDEDKDWVQEKARMSSSLDEYYKNLIKLGDLFVKHEKKIREYIAKDETLAKYKTKIEMDFFKGANHRLTGDNELIGEGLGDTGPFLNIFDAWCDDQIAKKVYDSNGRKFTDVTWDQLFTHADEKVRIDTYKSYFSMGKNSRFTLTNLNFYVIQKMHKLAKLRKYASEIEWKAEGYYDISVKNYWYIIDQCEKFAKARLAYSKVKNHIVANAYGLKTINPWDYKLEIEDIYQPITQPEAKKIVIDSLSCLGQDYCDKILKFYSKDLVKWLAADEEDINGYCLSGINTLDENPIKIKWNGTITGATTLSHELGHNLKNLYGRLNNEVDNEIAKMNCEIPSIVNQYITLFYLLDKYKKEKNAPYLYGIYIKMLNYFFTNVSDHGTSAEYRDDIVHAYIKNKDFKPLALEKLYMDNYKRYYGMTAGEYKAIASGKPIQWIIRLKAYFDYLYMAQHSNANMVGYYLGCIIGIVLAHKIYHGDKKTLNRYLKFLKAGNKTDPLKNIKILGLDATKPHIYTEAKHLIEKLILDFAKDIKVEDKPTK